MKTQHTKTKKTVLLSLL